jgi:hypothetical protein
MSTKLKLNLDQLSVESFGTTKSERPKGTVFGEQCTCYTNCTCPGCPTCDNTCAYTCDDATCPACPTCANCGTNTCGVSCYNTDCGCNPEPGTCYDTACGLSPCCI